MVRAWPACAVRPADRPRGRSRTRSGHVVSAAAAPRMTTIIGRQRTAAIEQERSFAKLKRAPPLRRDFGRDFGPQRHCTP